MRWRPKAKAKELPKKEQTEREGSTVLDVVVLQSCLDSSYTTELVERNKISIKCLLINSVIKDQYQMFFDQLSYI